MRQCGNDMQQGGQGGLRGLLAEAGAVAGESSCDASHLDSSTESGPRREGIDTSHPRESSALRRDEEYHLLVIRYQRLTPQAGAGSHPSLGNSFIHSETHSFRNSFIQKLSAQHGQETPGPQGG